MKATTGKDPQLEIDFAQEFAGRACKWGWSRSERCSNKGTDLTTKRKQHVVPHPDCWAVKPEGGKRPSSVHDTQQEAIDRGHEIARNQEMELFIHRRDGRIRERDSHGRDPFPSKG